MNYDAPELKELLKLLEQHAKSPRTAMMHTAERYFENDNDILARKRTYVGEDGQELEDKRLSNARLAHPIFPKLVNQKVSYLLAKPFSLNCENEAQLDILSGYFDPAFMRLLKNVGTEAVLCGLAWVQVYYDEAGRLCFVRIPSKEVIPLWADGDHERLHALMRVYTVDPDSEEAIVEYYTASKLLRYSYKQQKLSLLEQGGHAAVKLGDELRQADFGKIPFVAFRYNAREIPLIKLVKPLLDDYDTLTSSVSNDLNDTPNAIKVIKGYAESLGAFVRNLAIFRAVNVAEGGSVESVATHLDTSATEAHLLRLRKDLYDGACCVDSQEQAIGNTSGVALRLRYADLDMDCQNMACEFSAALEQLIGFVRQREKLSDATVSIVFNTDVAVNETETIANCVSSEGLVSRETLLSNHPWVKDVEAELASMDEPDPFDEARQAAREEDEDDADRSA
ncbi:MAG: phage portal protein [Myxococcota bacterium]|jgi:SPP1 family phage portal protein|nr:phage portal protein [Myxococcota bacterium]